MFTLSLIWMNNIRLTKYHLNIIWIWIWFWNVNLILECEFDFGMWIFSLSKMLFKLYSRFIWANVNCSIAWRTVCESNVRSNSGEIHGDALISLCQLISVLDTRLMSEWPIYNTINHSKVSFMTWFLLNHFQCLTWR